MKTYRLPLSEDFETKINGKNSHLMVLKNRRGMVVALTDYGARVVSILVPNKEGHLVDVVLGFNSIKEYCSAQEVYHGATIGRFANRIAQASMELDGERYALAANHGPHLLHGGAKGFHAQLWDRQVSVKNIVDFHYTSADGEEGFPGTLQVHVSYELTEENALEIRYKATTDKTTVINLTNHSYFNLNGEGSGTIDNHWVEMDSQTYVVNGDSQLPTGEQAHVEGSIFDFREGRSLGSVLMAGHQALESSGGYDHTFLCQGDLQAAKARIYSPESGISLEVYTTEPGIHLYTGNYLSADGGKSGNTYGPKSGLCLETQHFANSPNEPSFPRVTLQPGEEFQSFTKFKFLLKK